MGAEVRDIKRRVVEVGERRVRYKVDGVAAAAKPGRGPAPPTAFGCRLCTPRRRSLSAPRRRAVSCSNC
jgi:hypothetical protein